MFLFSLSRIRRFSINNYLPFVNIILQKLFLKLLILRSYKNLEICDGFCLIKVIHVIQNVSLTWNWILFPLMCWNHASLYTKAICFTCRLWKVVISIFLLEHIKHYKNDVITISIIQTQPPEVFLNFFQNSQENMCVRASFLIKLQAWGFSPATLLKRDSGTGVFLWILRNFWEHLFDRIALGGCFWLYKAMVSFEYKLRSKITMVSTSVLEKGLNGTCQ